MLTTNVLGPSEAPDGAPVLVLLHGRGADENDLAGIRPALPPGVVLVLPRAPHPGSPWGYGPGWAWYQYEGGDRPDVESFRQSQAALDELLERLPERLGFQPGPVFLGGFSQGGTMSLGWALRNPGAVPAILVFSGFLPDHPDVQLGPAAVGDAAFWWGHGTLDPAVPHTLAVRGRSALVSAGAELESGDYSIGHGISPRELDDAVRWLVGRLTAY
jgi:phospholipase/carboxylesterase